MAKVAGYPWRLTANIRTIADAGDSGTKGRSTELARVLVGLGIEKARKTGRKETLAGIAAGSYTTYCILDTILP